MEIKEQKLAYTIKKQLSLLLQNGKIKDYRLDNKIITITKVEISKVLKVADIYISVYGQQKDISKHLKGLKASVYLIRKLLFKNIRLRYLPMLQFHLDQDFEKIDSLSYKFHQIENQNYVNED